MPDLVLGPLLRFVDETSATIWVETDAPCVVQVLDAEARTFTVHGHHYAFVDITGLAPGSATAYEVRLDGDLVWPDPGSNLPPSRIRTLDGGRRLKLAFGSCRTSVPHDDVHNRSHGLDVLRALGHALSSAPDDEWPDLMLMLGDQVYADEPSEPMLEFIRKHRGVGAEPVDELANFEEYTHLYKLAWSEPNNRWLLSTLPTMMIFDDHDIRDDWNTSLTWRKQMAQLAWWQARIVGGLGAYWIYQHAGNMSIEERAKDPLLIDLLACEGDGGDILDAFAARADSHPESNRWSYSRDIGRTRVVVLDSRCGRVLVPERRAILDEAEWAWFTDLAAGDVDHLLVGTSLPYLLPRGLHELEFWNEAIADGKWGRTGVKVGEKIRQGLDLEHWAAFHDSFDAMADMLQSVTTGKEGTPPASVVFLSGDVHYSYLMRATTGDPAQRSAIFQAVCSPIRNPLPRLYRYANTLASFAVAGVVGRLLARTAGLHEHALKWKLAHGPMFDNAIATLDIDGRAARLKWETAILPAGSDVPGIEQIGDVELTSGRG